MLEYSNHNFKDVDYFWTFVVIIVQTQILLFNIFPLFLGHCEAVPTSLEAPNTYKEKFSSLYTHTIYTQLKVFRFCKHIHIQQRM